VAVPKHRPVEGGYVKKTQHNQGPPLLRLKLDLNDALRKRSCIQRRLGLIVLVRQSPIELRTLMLTLSAEWGAAAFGDDSTLQNNRAAGPFGIYRFHAMGRTQWSRDTFLHAFCGQPKTSIV
jgi:hypothetical protein